MIVCPNCGRENAAHFNFCLDCGTELTAPAAQPFGDAATRPDAVPAPPAAAAPPVAAAPPAAAPVVAAPVVAAPAVDAAASATARCPVCGATVPAAMKFCGECGARIDPNAPPPNAHSQAAAAARQTQFLHAADVQKVMEPRARLISIDPTGREGMTFQLRAGETACGRVTGMILLEDPCVSPAHCMFQLADGRLSVVDAGSLNGVYVRLRDEVQLEDGDIVRMGRQLVRFEDATHLPTEALQRTPGDDTRLWGTPMQPTFGRLVQLLDDGRAGEVRLLRGTETRLGREVGDITFPTDGFVSGQHCQFTFRQGRVYLRDVGSSNGTYLRIRRERPLMQDDFLLLGNQMLRVDLR